MPKKRQTSSDDGMTSEDKMTLDQKVLYYQMLAKRHGAAKVIDFLCRVIADERKRAR
jgi:hypothetical protein